MNGMLVARATFVTPGIARIKTGVHVANLQEASDDEAGAGGHEQRQCHLSDDEHLTPPLRIGALPRSAAAFLERVRWIAAPHPERGRDAEQESAHNRDGEHVDEDRGVDSEVVDAEHALRLQPHERTGAGPAQQESRGSAES